MSFISEGARKPKQYNPEDYADKNLGVQVGPPASPAPDLVQPRFAQPAQPAPNMVTPQFAPPAAAPQFGGSALATARDAAIAAPAVQPPAMARMTNPYPDMTPSVQSSLAPPPAQPTPGAVESRVVAPAQTPPTDPAERLRWAYERTGIPQPAAGWNPAAGAASSSTAEYQRVHDIQVAAVEHGRADRAAETDKRRVSMGLKPLTPPKPEAAPSPLPASVFGEPTGDSNLDNAYANDATLKRLKTEEDHDAAMKEKRGDSPTLRARAAKRGKTAETQRTSVQKTYQAEKATKDKETADKIAKAADSARLSKESHDLSMAAGARAVDRVKADKDEKDRKKASAQLLGAAQDAAKDGRFDDAEKMAEAGQTNAADAAEASAFNAIRKEVQVAKTTEAAGLLTPEIAQTARIAGRLQKDLDATHAAIAVIRMWKKENPPLATDREVDAKVRAGKEEDEQKLIDQERQQSSELRQLWIKHDDLVQKHADTLAGVQAQPAPANPNQDLMDAYGRQASQGQAPAQVKNDADFDALPSGAPFIGPDGIPRRKP